MSPAPAASPGAPGDRFDVDISGVGVLSNPAIDEPVNEGA
jgi:hypothetical protein